jgi:hypothetical protein
MGLHVGGFKVQKFNVQQTVEKPRSASTKLSTNGKCSTISTAAPFALRFSKDEQ